METRSFFKDPEKTKPVKAEGFIRKLKELKYLKFFILEKQHRTEDDLKVKEIKKRN